MLLYFYTVFLYRTLSTNFIIKKNKKINKVALHIFVFKNLSRIVGLRVHRFSSTLLGLQVVLHSTDKMYATVFLHCIFILYLEYEFHN